MHPRYPVLIALSLLMLAGITSCRSHYEITADRPFMGIEAYTKNHAATHVIMVHGMGTKEDCDFDELAARTAYAMGFPMDSRIERTYNVTASEARIKKTSFRDGAHSIHYYYVHWSPVTCAFKSYVKEADDHRKRACANEFLKNKVVNDGFADVTSFANPVMREQILTAVSTAVGMVLCGDYTDGLYDGEEVTFRTVSKSAIEQVDRIFYVSGSFGSKVVAEATTHLLSRKAPIADTTVRLAILDQVVNRPSTWYMLSNQLPLLEPYSFLPQEDAKEIELPLLALEKVLPRSTFGDSLFEEKLFLEQQLQQPQPEKIGVDSFSLETFSLIMDQSAAKEQSAMLGKRMYEFAVMDIVKKVEAKQSMVSFYDPNDLLGYRVLPSRYDHTPYEDLVNVRIHVAHKVPLGLLANPLKAHEGSKNDPRVQKLMVEGWNGCDQVMGRRTQRKLLRRYEVYYECENARCD